MSLEAPAASGRPLSLAGAAAALVALWALLCRPWFVGGLVIPWDAKNHFYPQLRFLAAALHDGQSVAWAPYIYSGHPQLADPQALIFAPGMLLLALLDSAPSFGRMDAVMLTSLLLGGFGVLLIFKRSGWRLEGGLIGALAFIFGGAASARLQHTSLILSYSLLPLALWFLMQALDRRSVPYALGFGVAAATMAVGRDQAAFMGSLVLAGHAIYAWLAAPRRFAYLRSRAVPLAVAAVTGAALLALPLLLTAEMVARSNRAAIAYEAATAGSLTPWSLLTLAVPNFFGALSDIEKYWGPQSFHWRDWANETDRTINFLYMGAIPAVLVAWHGLAGRRLGAREVRFFVIVLAVALVYALGQYTPLFRALFEFPGVALYRRPADAVFIVGFALAVLGGYFAHRLFADGLPRLSRAAWIALGVGAASAIAAGLALAATHQGLGAAAIAVAWALGFGASAVAAIALAARWRARALLAALPLAVVMTADLARHNAGTSLNALDRADYAPLDPTRPNALAADLAARLAADRAAGRRYRVEILGLGGAWQNAPLAFRLEATLGYNPLRWADYETATGAGETAHLEKRAFTPLFPGYRSAMADLLGIRYIAAGVPIETLDPKLGPGDLPLVARIGNAYVYENPRALPRARFAAAIAVADTKRVIETGEWPADPREAAVLERKPPEWPFALGAAAPDATGPEVASVIIETYRHDEVIVAVTAPRPGMLVLHDLFHPAWRARLDEAPVAVYRANVLFRAVYVPAGRHTVRFTYHPIASAIERVRGRQP